jgi:hypothetical protein
VVARHFGASGNVSITKNPAAGVLEKHYYGQFQCDLRGAGGDAVRTIGLAGRIAEFRDEDPDVGNELIVHWLSDQDELSPSDQRLTAGFAEHDIVVCRGILESKWNEILVEAEILISDVNSRNIR